MSCALSLLCCGLMWFRRYSRKLFIVVSALSTISISSRSTQISTPTSATYTFSGRYNWQIHNNYHNSLSVSLSVCLFLGRYNWQIHNNYHNSLSVCLSVCQCVCQCHINSGTVKIFCVYTSCHVSWHALASIAIYHIIGASNKVDIARFPLRYATLRYNFSFDGYLHLSRLRKYGGRVHISIFLVQILSKKKWQRRK